jgi:hypothetical protein
LRAASSESAALASRTCSDPAWARADRATGGTLSDGSGVSATGEFVGSAALDGVGVTGGVTMPARTSTLPRATTATSSPPVIAPATPPIAMNRPARLAGTPMTRRVPHFGQRDAPVASGLAQTGQLKIVRSSSPIGSASGSGSGMARRARGFFGRVVAVAMLISNAAGQPTGVGDRPKASLG